MQKESFEKSHSRRVLFPGRTCYPLSGGKGNQGSAAEQMDQLEVILVTALAPVLVFSIINSMYLSLCSGSLDFPLSTRLRMCLRIAAA